LALSLTVPGIALSAEPQVTISPKWSDLNPAAKECSGFSEDSRILRVKTNGREIIHEFCSSYGKAEAHIIRDSKGDNFLILRFGQGRGTNATSEYLSVYKIEKHLEEYARILVSEPAGRSRCYYDYKIERPTRGGLIFLLTLRTDGADPEDAERFPTEKERIIHIQ